jgi:hypothetical protein
VWVEREAGGRGGRGRAHCTQAQTLKGWAGQGFQQQPARSSSAASMSPPAALATPGGSAPSGVTAAISSPLRDSSKPQMGEGATGLRVRLSIRMAPSASCGSGRGRAGGGVGSPPVRGAQQGTVPAKLAPRHAGRRRQAAP